MHALLLVVGLTLTGVAGELGGGRGSVAAGSVGGARQRVALGGEEEQGIKLYQQGKYAEAVAAFRAALALDSSNAELSYNLALALWRSGQLDEAETAAERAATLSNGALSALRDGLLGNLRYTKAKAAEQDPAAALALAEQARDHFVRGASQPAAGPEMVRNLERTLQLIDALRQKLEEQKKQDDQKQDKDQQNQENKDQENKDKQQQDKQQQDDQQQDAEQKPDPQQQDQQAQDEPQEEPSQQPSGEPKEPPPEPKPDETKPDEAKTEQKPPPQPAPGEPQEGKELSPEEKQRLLDKLEQLDEVRAKLRLQQKQRRPAVEKDW